MFNEVILMAKQQYIEAGKIVNTHGVSGEVKIEVWLDSPEFMKKFRRFFLKGKETAVLSSRVQKNSLLAKLEGVADMNTAMALKNTVVSIAREDAGLPEKGYFLCEIIGARVTDESGREIGILKDIEESPAAPLYIVEGEREYLIPGVPEFVRAVDLENETVTVHLMEGM